MRIATNIAPATCACERKYNPNDVEADRAYSSAYVEFVHYAQRLYDAAETVAPEPVRKTPAAPAHTH